MIVVFLNGFQQGIKKYGSELDWTTDAVLFRHTLYHWATEPSHVLGFEPKLQGFGDLPTTVILHMYNQQEWNLYI